MKEEVLPKAETTYHFDNFDRKLQEKGVFARYSGTHQYPLQKSRQKSSERG
jgi:hypothetical protein